MSEAVRTRGKSLAPRMGSFAYAVVRYALVLNLFLSFYLIRTGASQMGRLASPPWVGGHVEYLTNGVARKKNPFEGMKEHSIL